MKGIYCFFTFIKNFDKMTSFYEIFQDKETRTVFTMHCNLLTEIKINKEKYTFIYRKNNTSLSLIKNKVKRISASVITQSKTFKRMRINLIGMIKNHKS